MDIDYAIRKDEPPAISATSTKAAIELYENWERSNRLSIMFIKTHISAGIRGYIEKHDKFHELLKAIDDQFAKSVKSLASTLIIQFSTLRLIGVKGVRDHIMCMMDITAQLKNLEVTISESFLVQYILCTLPPQYSPFKISYNTHTRRIGQLANFLPCVCKRRSGYLWNKEIRYFSLFLVVNGRIMLRTREMARLNPSQALKRNPRVSFIKRRDI